MPGEDNAALVAQFLDELWNQRNLAAIDQLTTENYVVHVIQGDLLGREALKIVAEDYFGFFSFFHVSIVNQTSQDSQVVTRIQWDIALSLRDQALDIEIDRAIPKVKGVSIDRIANGQIAESWNMLDPLEYFFTMQRLSRDPEFVRSLPAVTLVKNGRCPRGQCPKGPTCHPC